jgi:hypothetical protein
MDGILKMGGNLSPQSAAGWRQWLGDVCGFRVRCCGGDALIGNSVPRDRGILVGRRGAAVCGY